MTWQEKIIAAHTAVTGDVSHFRRMKSKRYFVWQEEADGDLSADNVHGERCMTGVTDLFTHQEFDPWAEEIEKSFSACGIAWRLRDVQYEEDAGIIHYTWDWEVTDG